MNFLFNPFFDQKTIKEKFHGLDRSTEGPLLIASCRSGTNLASLVVEAYQEIQESIGEKKDIKFLRDIDFDFSDGETCVRLEMDVNGRDVFILQALQDPTSKRNVDENYLAFLFAVRAFREWGANRVTGVLPYLAYARQDKPTRGEREPITAQLMADLSIEAGLDRLITWAPHDNRIHGFYGKMPVDSINALPLFEAHFNSFRGKRDVIGVAPDAGAAAFMIPFCRKMDIRCAIAAKYRSEPEQAQVTEIMGNFEGISEAIVIDDMINTGGTVEAVIKKLYHEKGIKRIWLAVSHFLGSSQAIQRLENCHKEFGLQNLVVTNSVPLTNDFLKHDFAEVKSIALPLAYAIKCIHLNLPLLALLS